MAGPKSGEGGGDGKKARINPNPNPLPLPLSCQSPSHFEAYYAGQRAKKVVSDSPGLEHFAFGLVIFFLNLPDGQVLFFWEIQITEGLLSFLPMKKGIGAS